MAQPPKYEREFNFANQQALTPNAPLPASHVEAEFNRIKRTLDGTLANLAKIQRDDGEVANATIGFDQLKPELGGWVEIGEAIQALKEYLEDLVAYLVPITDHTFEVSIGQDAVVLPDGYSVVAYVKLEGLTISGWEASDGLTVTFPAITDADTGGAAIGEMIVGAGNTNLYAFDTLDGGTF